MKENGANQKTSCFRLPEVCLHRLYQMVTPKKTKDAIAHLLAVNIGLCSVVVIFLSSCLRIHNQCEKCLRAMPVKLEGTKPNQKRRQDSVRNSKPSQISLISKFTYEKTIVWRLIAYEQFPRL